MPLPHVHGSAENLLARTDPLFNLCAPKIERMLAYMDAQPAVGAMAATDPGASLF